MKWKLPNVRSSGRSRTPNPFPGLRPFETEEAELFFGRQDQVRELLGLMRRNRFLAVVEQALGLVPHASVA